MRLLAFCAADVCASRAMREVRSSWSVEMGVLEACELSDRELDDGDSRPVLALVLMLMLLLPAVFRGGASAVTPLPLPITRPPPKVLRVAMSCSPVRVLVHTM